MIHRALSRGLATAAFLSAALLVGCSGRSQTNQLPGEDTGGGAPSGTTPATPASSTTSGDDTSGGNDAGSSSTTPPPPPASDSGTTQTTGPAVMGLSLINADTDQPIANFDPIAEGATITLGDLPTQNLTIQAKVVANGATIGSIVFDFDGTAAFHTENSAPYSLSGDNTGDFIPLDPPLAAGAHTLKATPYSDMNGGGTAGVAKQVNFTVQ